MESQNHSHEEHDTTRSQETEFKKQLEELGAVTAPIAKALRKRKNGHEVDMQAAFIEARQLLDDFSEQITPARAEALTINPLELMDGYWVSIKAKKGVATTGIAGLDEALAGGFEPARLVVLLGAPGSGKTTFTNQMVNHMADAGRPVLYVTSEDAPMMLLAKTIARRGKINYSAVQRGYPTEEKRINEAFAEYRQQPSARLLRYLDATGGTTLNMIAKAARAHFEACKAEAKGDPILVVDYLQRLARGENLSVDLRQSVTAYTERLRVIAVDLHCTVIALSAMNRASGYHAGNSTIASAKESGDIDYTSDIILAIGAVEDADDPAPYMKRYMLRIDKNRQGAVTYDGGHILLDWYPSRQQFTQATKDDRGDDTVEEVFKSNGSRSNGRKGRR